MNGWYTPYFQQAPPAQQQAGLQTPEGEPIYLGPYTAQQAPYMECANCAQPITVGQRITVMHEWILAVTARGQLVYVLPQDWTTGDAIMHSDCATEFSHDHITKDECGATSGTCAVCGIVTDSDEGLCSKHSEALSGETE